MPDFLIADHGSIITIAPISEAAQDWIDENLAREPWQWLGGALCVDHRYAGDLIQSDRQRRLRYFPLIGSLDPDAPRVLGVEASQQHRCGNEGDATCRPGTAGRSQTIARWPRSSPAKLRPDAFSRAA